MDKKMKIVKFLSFCVEQFKHRHGGSGLSVGQLFAGNDIFRFLSDNFDVEHCLDAAQILDDIDMILRRKGVAI